MSFESTPVALKTADNTVIHAVSYRRCDQQNSAIMVVASATGVPQGYYRRFAEYAVKRGYDVITFDYRGIGASAPDTLKGYDVDYLDWAKQDLAAALSYANQQNLPVVLVGHSFGGHALGLLPDYNNLHAAYVFGTGAGWSGWMPIMERAKVNLMWSCIAPIIVKLHGYLTWSKLGMGEDLPLGVYRQWKRWCKRPNYFFGDPEYDWTITSFQRYSKPLKAVNATDDLWATAQSRDAFVNHYTSAELACEDISPDAMKMKSIGHMGYFKKHASIIWDDCLHWLDQQQTPANK